MQVERLELTGFRSYPALILEPAGGPQVLFGPNAAGKTNLLEALVVLARGTSHRAPDVELIAWEAPLARVAATIGHGPGHARDELEVALVRGEGQGIRKRLRVNGSPRRASALAEALRVVVFAPEEMLLVAGPPVLRRQALDSLAAARWPAYGRSLSTYGRALAQRNALLRRIREGEGSPDQLAYWDATVVEEGGRVVAWRLELLADLAAPLAAAHEEIAPAEGRLSLRYASNAPAAAGETPAEAFRRRLAETAEKELWQGTTLVGPHRDDAVFELDGRALAGFGSRGQQRSAILALKLAELELLTGQDGEPPLLLLDDVFSELDPDRRAHLVRRVEALPQAFVTTTALEDLDPALVARSTAWEVAPGRVRRAGTGAA
ncbi:MAG TPA: DNA replication and repair protein RecF [Candidatus Limnocylindrales bacterium]|nr:DNA replication and repair protein RecF [Candidatus Limnocylindrales bacterium]